MKIKRRSLHRLKVWTLRITVLVVLFGIYFFYTRTEFFTITSYDIQGVDSEIQKTIVTELKELSTKKRFLVLPNNKIFTYNATGIADVIRNNVKDLRTIDIRPSGLHTVKIRVTLLIPILKLDDTTAITEDGLIFNPSKDIHSYPVIIFASSTRETVKLHGLPFSQLVIGGEKVDAVFLENLLSISTKVTSLIFPVATITVEGDDITLISASSTSKVLFRSDADPKKVWSTLVSAIDTNPLKSKLENDKKNLLYLDVRYGNKVFYRFSDMSFQNDKGAAIMDPYATTTTASPGH